MFVGPAYVHAMPDGRFRKQRVQPGVLTLALELEADLEAGRRPDDFEAVVAAYRAEWLASDPGGWVFDDEERPLIRRPLAPRRPSERPNVIVFQLETFRGNDMGFLRPELSPSPTPFLDVLARDAAVWTRHLSFGRPTIDGFMAWHCSMRPNARHAIGTRFPHVALRCLPEVLREHGWHTAFFTGTDPDWDGQSAWLRRWYDESVHIEEAEEADRALFRAVAPRLVELGRRGPFMATIVSISNHYPFRPREPEFDSHAPDDPVARARDTTRYTDDALRELFDVLDDEPWFDDTIVVILGDHGYNLGEHDDAPGQRHGYRESIWVPLVVHAPAHLAPRRSDAVASLLDVAPTIADLVGVAEENPWLGHSLVDEPRSSPVVVHARESTVFAESDDLSVVLDPDADRFVAFARGDPLQQHDIAPQRREEVDALVERIYREQALTDYLLETDRVWRH
jgi:membrane-anchored protein YejM (alkaline phosphatase superfamily)